MTTITLPDLALDIEQLEALDARVAAYNESAKASLDRSGYLHMVLMGLLNEGKRKAIIAKGEALIRAAQQLSDADRLEATSRIEQVLIEISTRGN